LEKRTTGVSRVGCHKKTKKTERKRERGVHTTEIRKKEKRPGDANQPKKKKTDQRIEVKISL